jgi:putative ABC transport system permease protein
MGYCVQIAPMNVWQNILLAFDSIRANLTRTVITCLIISIGIMALVGILTAIDGVESSLVKNFSFMGANSYTIRSSGNAYSFGRNTKKQRVVTISYREAQEFQERFESDATISIYSNNAFQAVAQYQSEKTNPNMGLIGGDASYARVAGYIMEEGRNISEMDVSHSNQVAVVGTDVVSALFPNENPLDKEIKVAGVKLRIIGVFQSKGSAFDFGGDRIILVPVTIAKHHFPMGRPNYNIGVAVEDIHQLSAAVDYGTALFRQVRRLKVRQNDNFEISQSDSLSKVLMEDLQLIIVAAILIAAITLIGAAIALMNIMLVSVTERTREIGVRKSIGAKRMTILGQFVIEAITICQIGGLGGIVLGLIAGNLTSSLIGGAFAVPWNWVLLAIVVCSVVGLAAGLWPAYKASRVNPIEALRHE